MANVTLPPLLAPSTKARTSSSVVGKLPLTRYFVTSASFIQPTYASLTSSRSSFLRAMRSPRMNQGFALALAALRARGVAAVAVGAVGAVVWDEVMLGHLDGSSTSTGIGSALTNAASASSSPLGI